MIIAPDPRKGSSNSLEGSVQSRVASTQRAGSAFGLVLGAHASAGGGCDAACASPQDGGLDEAVGGDGATRDAGSTRDAAADSGSAAILAAWLAQSGGGMRASSVLTGSAVQAGASAATRAAFPEVASDPAGFGSAMASSGEVAGNSSGLLSGDSGFAGNPAALAAALMAAVNGGMAGSGADRGRGNAEDGKGASAEALLAAFLRGSSEGTAVSLAASSALLPDSAGLTAAGMPFQAILHASEAVGLFKPGANAGVTDQSQRGGGALAAAAQQAHASEASAVERRTLTPVFSEEAVWSAGRSQKGPHHDGDAGGVTSGIQAYSLLLGEETRLRMHLEATDALLQAGNKASTQHMPHSQGAPLAPAPREIQANTAALEGSVTWLASQHGGTATIDLFPPELGSLRIELKVDASGTSASLIVHAASDAARLAVEQALDRLYEAFQAAGMGLSVSVGTGSGSFSGYSPPWMAGERGIESSQGSRALGTLSDRNAGIEPGRRSAASDALSLYA